MGQVVSIYPHVPDTRVVKANKCEGPCPCPDSCVKIKSLGCFTTILLWKDETWYFVGF